MNYFSACFVFELLLERNQGQLQTSVEKHTKFLLRHILLGESFRTPTKLYKQCPDTRSINSKPAQTNTYNTVLSLLKKKNASAIWIAWRFVLPGDWILLPLAETSALGIC